MNSKKFQNGIWYLCFAAIQRIWSSNMNLVESKGTRLLVLLLNGLWIVKCKQRESSLSPATSMSCKKPTNFATPQPSFRVSGSTRISWIKSMTRNLRIFCPSFQTTVHAIRSLLSENNIFVIHLFTHNVFTHNHLQLTQIKNIVYLDTATRIGQRQLSFNLIA